MNTQKLENFIDSLGKSDIRAIECVVYKDHEKVFQRCFGHSDADKKVPLAEKYVELPEITENALVFIALQSKNGNCAVRYVGSINNLNPTFSQYLAYEIDYVYMIIAAIVVVLIIIVVILANNYRKNRQKRRRRR